MLRDMESMRISSAAASDVGQSAEDGGTREVPQCVTRAKAFIFDFDGVLCDSEPVWRRTYNKALEPYGVSIPEEEYWEYWASKGEGLEGQLRRHGITGVDIAMVEARQRAYYKEAILRHEVRLYKETPELLAHLLDARKGRPTIIASNSEAAVVEQLLRLGGAPVPPIVGSDGLRPKPAPDIFLAAARRLGVAPDEALVIEDAEKGIRAARAGGFPVLLVRNLQNRSLQLMADAEAASLGELLAWVRSSGVQRSAGRS